MDKGASVNTIATALDIDWSQARDVICYVETGKLPDWVKRPLERLAIGYMATTQLGH